MRSRSIVLGLLLAFSSTACGSGSSPSTSPLDHWTKAYAFLAAQTKPTEILCDWEAVNGTGAFTQATHVPVFHSFTDTASWKSHLGIHPDLPAGGSYELCEANVPTSVPYGPKINTFLAHHGLASDPTAPGTTPIKVNYAGTSPYDPDIIYRDKPGLYGLRMALRAIGTTPFVSGTSKIIQPTNSTAATQYLQYAQPLLVWYGYKG